MRLPRCMLSSAVVFYSVFVLYRNKFLPVKIGEQSLLFISLNFVSSLVYLRLAHGGGRVIIFFVRSAPEPIPPLRKSWTGRAHGGLAYILLRCCEILRSLNIVPFKSRPILRSEFSPIWATAVRHPCCYHIMSLLRNVSKLTTYVVVSAGIGHSFCLSQVFSVAK